jgi:hypothetical protein
MARLALLAADSSAACYAVCTVHAAAGRHTARCRTDGRVGRRQDHAKAAPIHAAGSRRICSTATAFNKEALTEVAQSSENMNASNRLKVDAR